MRRFHPNNEGVIPDGSVLALWRCDEAASASTLTDYSYGGATHLIKKGPGATSAQIGLFMSGLEGNPEPVAGMTLWWESDLSLPDKYTAAGVSVWPDLGPYTYASGVKTTCMSTSDAETYGDPLNGIDGMSVNTGVGNVYGRDVTDGSGDGPDSSNPRVDELFHPTTGDFTVFYLLRIPAGAADFKKYLQIPTATPWSAIIDIRSGSLYFGEPGSPSSFVVADTDPHLIVLSKSGTTWSLYYDDMTTPVLTKTITDNPPTIAGERAITVYGADGASASRNYAMIIYPSVLSQADREANFEYLSSSSRFGTW